MRDHRLFKTLEVIGLGVALGAAGLAAQPPVAVSPGEVSRVAPTGDACPTFSWGAVVGAKGYELVVYRLGEEGEEAQPVLEESFDGSVFSWTPSLDRCLERGSQHAWSVRAVGGQEAAEWSVPNLFEVASGPSEAELEAALATVQQYLAARHVASVPARPTATAASEEGAAAAAVSRGGSPTSLVPEAPAVVSLVTEGALGVGTSSPLADLHVVGGPLTGGMLLAPGETGSDALSEILLAEDHDGTFGMKIRYDGTVASGNFLRIFGLANGTVYGPWLSIGRNTGAATFGGTIFGDGSGLSAVNADTLDGMDSSAFSTGAHTVDTDTFVTNKDAHDHEGGDGASVPHSSLSSLGASDHHAPFENPDGPCFDAMRRFADCGNGTVTDTVTGLIYLKNANCFGTQNWVNANQSAAGLADGGCGLTDGSRAGDWRLQTKEEWEGILDSSCSDAPKIVGNQTSGGCYTDAGDATSEWASGVVSSLYESSTTNSAFPTGSWYVDLNTGNVFGGFSKALTRSVWPVRGGQ